MSLPEQLFARLKPSIDALATSLFDASRQRLITQGRCLPHAATQDALSHIAMLGTDPEQFPNGRDRTTQIMLYLHCMLRARVRQRAVAALAIAETVTITPQGRPRTSAIKVLYEHQSGLAVALYMPFKKRLLGGYVFGEVMTFSAEGEVNPWATLRSAQRPSASLGNAGTAAMGA
jgi:hypothetical protein